MRDWLKSIFKKEDRTKDPEWLSENSIFAFLLANRDTDGKLTGAAQDLPDEERDTGKLRYAPGLMDNVFGLADSDEAKHNIQGLAAHLKKVAETGDEHSKYAFYKLLTEGGKAIGIIDKFLEAIISQALPVQPFLFSFAKDLATRTGNRNAVKFGIAILGLCRDRSVLPELTILGMHDELTLFAAVAVKNLSDDPATALWNMAKNVDGWGRINLVERLAGMKMSEPIKDWLVLEGYKNRIMHEYLAFICADKGALHEKLQSATIDRALFKASGDIIDALITGGPAKDISDYEQAASVIGNFIRHAQQQPLDIGDFVLLHKIQGFLSRLHEDVETNEKNGWTPDTISNSLIDIAAIIQGRDWTALMLAGLRDANDTIYWNAKQAARLLGFDLWETIWQRLQTKPLDYSAWYDVTYYRGDAHTAQIVDFAMKNLPLGELATGPKDLLGLDDHYSKHMCLESVIIYLAGYPANGGELIIAGLNSPVTRTRNMCIKTLHSWKQQNWSDEIKAALTRLERIEPNKSTLENIRLLLKGEALTYPDVLSFSGT